nr:NADH dehydrogenase subunit 6 [Conicera dauci]
MLQNLIMLLILLTAITFMQMKHPLAMGLMLLIQTLLICIFTGMLNETYWFSYILFLVFLGGMLILFIYVTSLASNETFSLSIKMLMFLMFNLFILASIMLLTDNLLTNQFFNYETLMNFETENSMNLNKLFNYPTNLITILLMNYLLITLIAVVKITNIFHGPLRQMF